MSAERPRGISKLETESIPDDPAFARRVRWIEWDSGFRGSGLRVGDRVLGEMDERYTPETDKSGEALGAPAEDQVWARCRLWAGDDVSILVERQGAPLRLQGKLVEYRSYYNDAGVAVLGEGGPVRYEKDGFDYDWYAWYRNFADQARWVLAGWDYTVGYDTRQLRGQVEPFRERVAFLEHKYPGPFARAAREDFDAMLAMLAGERRELTAADLEYRQLGARRTVQMAQAADAAYQLFLAEIAGNRIAEPFPAPNPFREDYHDRVGKIVVLPEVGDRELLLEVKGSWYQAGDSDGVYLVDRHGEAMQPLYAAIDKYIEQVHPGMRDQRFAFAGVIEERPALVSDVRRDITVVGLRVRPIAALVADAADAANRFFVDLRAEKGELGTFAGQSDLLSFGHSSLPAQAGPADVLRATFECLKLADFDLWRQCFADWKVREWFEKDSSYLYVDLSWMALEDSDAARLWDFARQRLLDDVFGVEVARVGEVRPVYDASAQPAAKAGAIGQPHRVDEVTTWVNHIGQFDGEYHTFAGYNLHRRWTLQRLDDGPWRIIDPQSI